MRILGLLIICLFSGPAAVAAQLEGRVLNPQGAGLPGVKVTIQGGDGEASREVVTGTDGSYTIENLEPGTYTVTVAAPSVVTPLSRQVTVEPGAEPVRADFQFPQAPATAAPAAIAAEERNPNIFVYRIDLNDLRNRLTTGRGPDPAYVPQFSADQNYFGAEFGASLFGNEILRPRSLLSQWRGSLSALHQNSALNARNYFNVGPLQASRSTSYSATGTGPLGKRAALLLQYGQTLTSGAVNGNIQAPPWFRADANRHRSAAKGHHRRPLQRLSCGTSQPAWATPELERAAKYQFQGRAGPRGFQARPEQRHRDALYGKRLRRRPVSDRRRTEPADRCADAGHLPHLDADLLTADGQPLRL